MATVTRENIGLLNDKIVVKVDKTDYLNSFEKALKNYSKQANIPGFRKGMVPAGMIKKMHGQSVFTDEVLRSVEKELNDYMVNEKLEIFAQPLPLPENDARSIDMNNPAEYAFAFEVGLKPEFQLPDLAAQHPVRFKIEVTDEMVNEEVERQRNRHGKMTEPETVDNEDCILNLQITETDEAGNNIEGGISKDNSLLVKYFAADTRSQWMGKKAGDSLVLQLSKGFEEKERDWVISDLGLNKEVKADAEKFFRFTISKLGFVEKAELNEEFFKAAMPGKEIATEEELRNAIRAEIQAYWDKQSSNQLQHELYHILLDKTQIDFPELFLKRWMQQGGEKQLSNEEVDQEFPGFANQLKWTLISDKLSRENNITVEPADIHEFARQQLFGYMGMPAGGEEQPWIAEYVTRMMQDKKFVEDAYHRIQMDKLFVWAETQVNPVDKPISVEDFSKEVEKHQHHHH